MRNKKVMLFNRPMFKTGHGNLDPRFRGEDNINNFKLDADFGRYGVRGYYPKSFGSSSSSLLIGGSGGNEEGGPSLFSFASSSSSSSLSRAARG